MQESNRFMLKWPASLLFCFLSVIIACSDDEPDAVEIVNDDLEGSIAWQFVNVAPATHAGVVVTSVSASSSHSLSTTSSAALSDGFSFWRLTSTPTNVPVGASLELTVKVKVTNVTGNGVFVAMRGDAASNPNSLFFETTQGVQTIDGTADFTTYSVKLDSYPEGVKYVYIFLIMDANGTGSVNFDDITLTSHPK